MLACKCDSVNSFSTARRDSSEERGARSPRAESIRASSKLLIEARPRALRKKELIDRLWPDVVVEEANLKNLIAEIRAVIGTTTIRTVQRYGYAFSAADSEAPVSVARLIDGNRIHRLTAGENLIGRDHDCSVILDFTGVSRHHARIRIADGRNTSRTWGAGTVRGGTTSA